MRSENVSSDSSPRASRRPLRPPVPVRNPVTLLLLWVSKSDPRLAAVSSPWARATQAAFGVFVCFTTAMAFCAAYYTLSTLGVIEPWPARVAVMYSIFLLVLEREIVGGLDKATAWIRLLLALVIGTIIAVPVELRVFESRIDQELARLYRQNNKEQLEQLERLRAEEDRLESGRGVLRTTLADLRRQEADWGHVMDDELVGRPKTGRTGVGGAGPVFGNAKLQQVAVRQRIQEVRREIEDLERTLPAARNRLEVRFQREEVAKVTDFTTRYEALQKVTHTSSALNRLSWGVTLFFVLLEMTPALMKILTPHVDYHHLVNAEIRENIARIDEIADRNYRLAMENPELPRLSVSEKFALVRYSPVFTSSSRGREE